MSANNDRVVDLNEYRVAKPDKYYARVPLAAATMLIFDHKTRVYIVICSHTNDAGECKPSHKTIGKEAGGLSRRDVRRAIAALEHDGVIEVCLQTRQNGGKSTNRYIVAHLQNPRHGMATNPRHGMATNPRHECEDILLEERRTEERELKRERTAISKDWIPDDDGVRLALSCGFELTWLVEKFRDYHLSEGTRKPDWNAAFKLWVRREAEFQARQLKGAKESGSATLRALSRLRFKGDNEVDTDITRPTPRPEGYEPGTWSHRIEQLKEDGIWREDWGPTPNEAACELRLPKFLNQWNKSAVRRWRQEHPP